MRKTLIVLLLIVTLAVGMIGAVSAEPTTSHNTNGSGSHIDNGQWHQSPHDNLPQCPCHHHLHHHHAKK